MPIERKKVIVTAVMILVPFVVGLVLGFAFLGSGRNKQVDYKQILQQTISYIDTIEKQNAELGTKVDSLQTEVGVLKQQGQQEGSQSSSTITTLNQRVQSLETENQRLKSQVQSLSQKTSTTGVQ